MKTAPVQWILASGSPRRRELLARIVPRFRVEVPDVEEWEPEEADPAEQVEHNAHRKGQAIADRFAEAVVLGADTTVALGRRLLAKPADRDAAIRMLGELSGREHQVLTGMALFHKGKSHVFHETSRVFFRELDQDTIERYIDRVHVYDKAGAYGIQEHGDLLIARYTGSYENIMGLPVQRLQDEWVQLGWTAQPDLAD